mgnify:CR=1 FL=1
MGEITYQPLRSLIYVDCVKEEYRHKLQHWLYYYHAPESIAKFEPWVTKYAFYNALPTPSQGERFGTYRMQLTEHYWMVNPMSQESLVNSLNEYFPIDAMIWQGTLPEMPKRRDLWQTEKPPVLPVVITDARRLFLHFTNFLGTGSQRCRSYHGGWAKLSLAVSGFLSGRTQGRWGSVDDE